MSLSFCGPQGAKGPGRRSLEEGCQDTPTRRATELMEGSGVLSWGREEEGVREAGRVRERERERKRERM